LVRELQKGLLVPVGPVYQAVQYFQYLPQFPLHLVGQAALELRTVLSVPIDQLVLLDPVCQDFPGNQQHLVVLDFQAYLPVH